MDMIWQDIVITAANIVLSAALIPQVYYGFKKKKGVIAFSTSIPTSLGLYVMAFAFFSLKLYYSTAVIFLAATLWLVLFMQRMKYGKT